MSLTNNSNEWLDYVEHVLFYEGGLSKRQDDTAKKCVPEGQYHTNKGVTFCTFKELAPSLGISPVTYEKFLNLTNSEVAKFMYRYYENVQGPKFPPSIGLLLTEIAWMSGPSRAFSHLEQALKNLGVKAGTVSEMISAVKKLDVKEVFDELTKERKKYLDFLVKSPIYVKNKKGWFNRLNSFLSKFPPTFGGKKKMDSTFTISDFIDLLFK